MASFSSNSAASSSHNSVTNKGGRCIVSGIPITCWCGCGIVEKTSTSVDNPCRRYYRCLYAYTNKLRHDPHVFKWVDEAYRNEIEKLDCQMNTLEEELRMMKASGGGHTERDAMNEFSIEVLGNVEEVMVQSLRQVKRMLAAVIGVCVLVVGLVVVMK